MSLNFDDKGICTELIVNKTREVLSTDHFQKIITENMTIIDIGANIGYYALLESQLASKGHIFAIEPVLGNYTLLKKNIALNHCTNISTYNFAIADADGYKEMYIYDKCNWSAFTKIPGSTIIDTVRVPIFTLDKFVETHVPQHLHFIRMDVEGFEYEILIGSQKTLQKPGPLIFCIEIHPHLISKEKVTTIIDLMRDNGFAVNAIFNDMDLSEYNFINLFNQLQKSLDLSLYGYLGHDFDSLEKRLAHGGAIVFFEKSGSLTSSSDDLNV
jgi:FkbM family methyltransferase